MMNDNDKEALNKLRADIEAVDREMLALFERRMAISEQIADVKRRSGQGVVDSAREHERLEAAARAVDEKNRAGAQELMRALMGLSKRRQNELLGSASASGTSPAMPESDMADCANNGAGFVAISPSAQYNKSSGIAGADTLAAGGGDTMKNVVLIGMPGSGKTTVGALVAEMLGRPWFDSDTLIEQREGMPITQIFTKKGEPYFRMREAECLAMLGREHGAVISAGGGAVLHGKELLKRNAVVVYLERSVDNILSTLDDTLRPLAQGGRERLDALYHERRPLYEGMSDITVSNNGPLEATVRAIVEELPCDCSY